MKGIFFSAKQIEYIRIVTKRRSKEEDRNHNFLKFDWRFVVNSIRRHTVCAFYGCDVVCKKFSDLSMPSFKAKKKKPIIQRILCFIKKLSNRFATNFAFIHLMLTIFWISSLICVSLQLINRHLFIDIQIVVQILRCLSLCYSYCVYVWLLLCVCLCLTVFSNNLFHMIN